MESEERLQEVKTKLLEINRYLLRIYPGLLRKVRDLETLTAVHHPNDVDVKQLKGFIKQALEAMINAELREIKEASGISGNRIRRILSLIKHKITNIKLLERNIEGYMDKPSGVLTGEIERLFDDFRDSLQKEEKELEELVA